MGMFFKKDYEQLDAKIRELERDIDTAYSILSNGTNEQWNNIMELIKEIHNDFKTIRYPTREERDNAWQTFFALRRDAYDKRNRRFEYISADHERTLLDMLGGLDYWALRDELEFSFRDLQELKDDMIERGKKLNEAARYFKSVKHEMTGDHKAHIHQTIIEIRESHEIFWERYKAKVAELAKFHEQRNRVKEQQQRDYEERKERKEHAKLKLEENVENLKEKLAKAENALSNMLLKREKLEDQLDNAYTSSFRERCEEWLDELNAKIEDVERYIEKLKSWIEDGEDRLRNWK